jgi:RNA polymerase sigma-70 factor (ECF subfamily)
MVAEIISQNYVTYLNFCKKMCLNTDDAKDLMQNASIKAIEKQHLFDGTNFSAWFCTIIKNTFINGYRREIKHPQVAILEYVGKTHMNVVDSIDAQVILNEIDNSNDRDHKFLKMYAEGYMYEEIAEMYSLPLGTVKHCIFVARKYFKAKYLN